MRGLTCGGDNGRQLGSGNRGAWSGGAVSALRCGDMVLLGQCGQ